jgi:hypothetical protein
VLKQPKLAYWLHENHPGGAERLERKSELKPFSPIGPPNPAIATWIGWINPSEEACVCVGLHSPAIALSSCSVVDAGSTPLKMSCLLFLKSRKPTIGFSGAGMV